MGGSLLKRASATPQGRELDGEVCVASVVSSFRFEAEDEPNARHFL
jgi:hypothetical protein